MTTHALILRTHKRFEHHPLNTENQQIRLLKLDRRPKIDKCYDKITGTLQHFELDNAPKYITLSYEWGPPAPTRSIWIGRNPLTIRENLFHCLERLAFVESGSWLWIDQICIDQSSTEGRNHQVQFMSEIYRRCSEVIIWLGLPMASRILDFDHSAGLAMGELLDDIRSARYFTRMWTVQEVLLAPYRMLLRSDGRMLEWRALEDEVLGQKHWEEFAFLAIRTSHLVDILCYDTLTSLSRRSLLSLEEVLRYFSALSCDNPRDRIYGLLGLVHKRHRVEVDYHKSVCEVFIDVIRSCYRYDLEIAQHLSFSVSVIKTLDDLDISLGIKEGVPRFLSLVEHLRGSGSSPYEFVDIDFGYMKEPYLHETSHVLWAEVNT